MLPPPLPPRASLLAHLLSAATLGGAPLRLLQLEGLVCDPAAQLALLRLPRTFTRLAHLGLRGTSLGANALCAMVALACGVTLPLHHQYITVTVPLHYRYITGGARLPRRLTPATDARVRRLASWPLW